MTWSHSVANFRAMVKKQPVSFQQAKARRDAKLKEVRRRQNVVIAAVVVALVTLLAGAVYLYTSDIWDVRRVEVTGAKRLKKAEIVSTLDLEPRTSLLKFSSESYARRLAKLPWLKKVAFSRRLPSTLVVVVEERRPLFAVKAEGKSYVVDEEGLVIVEGEAQSGGLTPLESLRLGRVRVGQKITSAAFRNAARTLRTFDDATRGSVMTVSAPSVDQLSIWTKDEVEIVLGRAGRTNLKMAVARKIIETNPSKVVYIDVTAPKAPIVKEVQASPR